MYLTDHPGWQAAPDRDGYYRAVTTRTIVSRDIDPGTGLPVHTLGETAAVMMLWDEGGSHWLNSEGGHSCLSNLVRPANGPQELIEPLAAITDVAHLEIPDLWEAVAGALVRHERSDTHARRTWQALCHAHGDPVTSDGLTAWRFPRPDQILTLPDDAFTTAGAHAARAGLRAAAQACADHTGDVAAHENWETLWDFGLLDALKRVPHVRPWAAAVAVAEFTGDYSHYPLDEPTRHTIAQLVPGQDWPEDPEDFRRAWNLLTDGDQRLWNRWICAWRLTHTPIAHQVNA
ncbi:hypothetical protein [Nocardia wallacei]|uniref:hypothetical protein n=1 Tax=Nocardia wallacei TaxID=480035 RepID=UPI002455CEC2|nr:hypothetical protein [Nocardia wallacei]